MPRTKKNKTAHSTKTKIRVAQQAHTKAVRQRLITGARKAKASAAAVAAHDENYKADDAHRTATNDESSKLAALLQAISESNASGDMDPSDTGDDDDSGEGALS